MNIQTTSSDRLRTIWTTAMDRYFIDLMLEQIDKGSRIDGHLFSKRAWRNMTLLFNARFRLQYNREHLKNRHKTLRRVYRAVRNLLDQNGFSWDETQQMVTADDRVWSNYIKAHPEARSYRTKSIPCYNDLCKIYKSGIHDHDNKLQETSGMCEDDEIHDQLQNQQSAVPSTSLLSTDEGVEDAFHDMATLHKVSANGKEENNSLSPENVIDTLQIPPDTIDSTISSRSRTYWQPPMDSYFIELMLDQVHQGNQFDGTFRKHAWTNMAELFNSKFGFKYDPIVLKNRYKTLKRQYTAIKVLLDQRGFIWDDVRQMVTAEDHTWHDYIKAHPDAKQYITRPIPYYNDLCVIFSDATVDEGYSHPFNDVDQQDGVLARENDRLLRIRRTQGRLIANGDPIQEGSSNDMVTSDRKHKYHFATLSTLQSCKKPRRGYDGDFEDAFYEANMVESSNLGLDNMLDKQNKNQFLTPLTSQRLQGSNDESIANALREMAAVLSSLSDWRTDQGNSITTENAIHALQAIPDIDDDLVLDGCDLLEDEKKANTFLSLDVRLRKKWLVRKLRPEHLKFG